MRHDTLADVLSTIKNAEHIGKRDCVTPASNLAKEILKVIQKEGYIGKFEFVDDGRSGKLKVELKSRINSAAVIKPRYSVEADEFERWEKRFLPAKGFGVLIVSTTKGVMTHKDARAKRVGGRLLGYVF